MDEFLEVCRYFFGLFHDFFARFQPFSAIHRLVYLKSTRTHFSIFADFRRLSDGFDHKSRIIPSNVFDGFD
jgi:hypothetical protein